MDIKEIMTHDVKTYRDRAEAHLDRIQELLEGLDHIKGMINGINEEDTRDALEEAYVTLQEAFIKCIDAEQSGVAYEVRR